jgi:hypothetical protein
LPTRLAIVRRDTKEKAAQDGRPFRNQAAEAQASRREPSLFRRYAIKPRPKKPRIIIAQVEGSGTAALISVIVRLSPALPKVPGTKVGSESGPVKNGPVVRMLPRVSVKKLSDGLSMSSVLPLA